MKKTKRLLWYTFFLPLMWFFSGNVLYADVKLPQVLGDHMVLQRDQAVKIWGWADRGEKIRVIFHDQEVKTRAGKDGSWEVILHPMKAGGPFEMQIEAKNKLVLRDILVGDVWICSGQSNMEWPVSNSNDAEEEIAAANYPEIRIFDVPRNLQLSPVQDLPSGKWQACSPGVIGPFSAVGYFFGRYLHKELGVPIGLIGSNWGGTNVETWTSREMAQTVPEMASAIEGLGQMDIAALKKKMEEERLALLASLGELESGMENGNPIWAMEDLDEQDWKTMALPGLWENKGLQGVDGVVWFRKKLMLTAEQAAQGAVLHMGAIDDNDLTWINGQQVGETNAYNTPRSYQIPAAVWKEGRNVIVVRVEDTGGGGGFWGDPESMVLQSAAGDISISGDWLYRVSSEGFSASVNTGIGPNERPTLLYNGMIHPLINFSVQGAIWYQGESNAGRAYAYRTRFPNLIKDWRNKWENPDLGFYFVQLANYRESRDQPGESDWAELREAQTMTLSLPKTGMAVTIDIGEAGDIHPRNKQDVGKRLALAALHDTYGRDVVYSGPVYKGMKVEASQVYLEMDPMGSKLEVRDKYGYVKGFALAGKDRVFHWAAGKIDGNVIVLHSDQVQDPVAVRYAWADNPDDANLYNAEGLPASPFRTDEWPGITFED